MTVRDRINQIYDTDCAALTELDLGAGGAAYIVAKRVEAIVRYLEEQEDPVLSVSRAYNRVESAKQREANRELECLRPGGGCWEEYKAVRAERDAAVKRAEEAEASRERIAELYKSQQSDAWRAKQGVEQAKDWAIAEVNCMRGRVRDFSAALSLSEAKCVELGQAQRLTEAERAVVEAAERWGSADHTDTRAPADLSRALIELRAQRQASAEVKGV